MDQKVLWDEEGNSQSVPELGYKQFIPLAYFWGCRPSWAALLRQAPKTFQEHFKGVLELLGILRAGLGHRSIPSTSIHALVWFLHPFSTWLPSITIDTSAGSSSAVGLWITITFIVWSVWPSRLTSMLKRKKQKVYAFLIQFKHVIIEWRHNIATTRPSDYRGEPFRFS